MVKWIVVGTVAQVAMVLVGHWVAPVANLFGILGVTISLVVALLWARAAASSVGAGARGGAVVGGACALIGIGVSFGLGDVEATVLVFGTLSSALTGAIGGAVGGRSGTAGRPREAAR